MHSSHRSTLICVLFFICNSLLSQKIETEKQFDSLIQTLTYEIGLDENKLFGEGLEWLTQQAKASNYFLIGERHGTAEIPQACAAIYSSIGKVGYNHAILEIGFFAAYKVRKLLEEGGYNSLRSFLESGDYYQAIAFLDWEEEAKLAAEIVRISPLGSEAIWGVDQEFIFGCAMYLDMLMEEAKTVEQKKAIGDLKEELNENKFLLGSDIGPDLNSLKELYDQLDDQFSIELLESLLVTNQIYGRFRGEMTRVASNALRENQMKITFKKLMERYEEKSGGKTKVFFKMGGFHSAPYISLGHSTFGTFVEDWAISRNEIAFNLFIDSNGGKTLLSGQDSPQGGDGTADATSQFGKIDPMETELLAKHIFSNQLSESEKIFLIDLQPLRERMDELSPYLNTKARNLISGFDAYMAIPNVTPATPIPIK